MSELRAATRQSTARTGIIEFDGARGAVSIPCTIADVSSTGARLKLDWSLSFPKEATLVFADGLRKACRVAWQKRRLLGVAFADGVASADEQALMMTEEEQALHRQHIGAQVKGAREARGYTEAQIANLVGVSPEFVSRAENGEISIPLHQLTHMADLLLVDLDSLVAGPASIDAPPVDTRGSDVELA
jgi:DNA-binding XRE family transcriptional regulator